MPRYPPLRRDPLPHPQRMGMGMDRPHRRPAAAIENLETLCLACALFGALILEIRLGGTFRRR